MRVSREIMKVHGVILAALGVLALAWALALPAAAQTLTKDSLEGMKWRLVGPFRGGRVETVVGVPGDPYIYYFGAAAGGVWKTTNGGLSWAPIFDKESNPSIGVIAIAPSDTNVIYVGTGEPCLRGDITNGNGMYKSVDAGKTWTHIGLEDTHHIAKVLIDPQNPDVVLVAAIGHAFGPNEERGVFRTTDGGKTWKKVLYKDDKTGAVDLAFGGGNAHIVFAAMYQEVRKPWDIISGGPGSGLYKSSDGGVTWEQVKGHGFPEVLLGRIGVATSPADPERVWALVEAEKDKGGVYESNDEGESWHLVTGDHRFLQRAFYYTHIFADPTDADRIYIQNVGSYRSMDGGKTWDTLHPPHGDNHALWIDPKDPKRIIAGDDGGAAISVDGANSWTAEDNQPTAQFYHVAADNQYHYYLYGAQQDNSTMAIASSTDHGYIGRQDWYDVGGGESGYIAPDPTNAGIVYAGGNYGIITRWDKTTDEAHLVTPAPVIMDGSGAAEQKYRFQWTAPIVISPFDPHTLYIAAQVLFKSTDEGQSWTVISPDLTRNDKSKQQMPGGPITKDSTSVEFYDTIFTVAESPKQRDLIWAGSDDGLVHLTRDGGKNWEDVTPKGLPEWSKISLIEASPFDAGTAYMAVDRHMLDDFQPYAYKTTDFGKTWTKITEGIPSGSFVRAVREDPRRKGLLFAGTETGVLVSFDDGGHWQSLQLNLPVVPVHDLIVKNDDLAIATHGRSFWVLDDISPLREMKAGDLEEAAHLFAPAPAYRSRGGGGFFHPRTAGANPPGGVIIDYSFKAEPKDDITLEILDASGKTVRKYSSKEKKPGEVDEFFGRRGTPPIPKKAGLNRVVWDMRYEPPRGVPGAVYDNGPPEGVLALPGKYEVKLTAEGKSYTEPVELQQDPRAKISAADLERQFKLATQIRDLEDDDNKIVLEIRDLRAQVQAMEKRLGQDDGSKSVRDAAEALKKKIADIENELIEPKATANEDQLNYGNMLNSQLSYLLNSVDDADVAPTQAEEEQYEAFRGQMEKIDADWKGAVTQELAQLNELMRKNNILAVGVTEAAGEEGASH
ncbi:MAG TPA: hypothetical protein VMH00_04370 [Candidatus Limnocylindrales bacterium]|nr:hypothetical protein [Candidatus Limnocylindrales bacterium]